MSDRRYSLLGHTHSGIVPEVNDLSSIVTWANIPDANVPQSAVTQHQTALTITESQISDLAHGLTDIVSDLTPQLGGNLDMNGKTIAGIAEANFLDKTAGESISGVWNHTNRLKVSAPAIGGAQGSSLTLFSSNCQFSMENTAAGTDEKVWNWSASGAQLRLRLLNDVYSGSATNIITFQRSGDTPTSVTIGAPLLVNGDVSVKTGNDLQLFHTDDIAGASLRMSSSNTASLTSISGLSFFNISATTQILSGKSLVVLDSGNTDTFKITHTGTDVSFDHVNTTDWNISNLSGFVWIRDGAGLRISEADDTTQMEITHDTNSTDFRATGTGVAHTASWSGWNQMDIEGGMNFRMRNGTLLIANAGVTKHVAFKHDDTDMTVVGTNTGLMKISGLDVRLIDNDELQLGTSADAKIFFNGTDMITQMAAGVDWRLFMENGTEAGIIAIANAGVHLYFNGAAKLSTLTGGINMQAALDVTGIATFKAAASGTTNSINIDSTSPGIWFKENDQASDEGGYKMFCSSADFSFFSTTDVGGSTVQIFKVFRGTGTAINSLDFGVKVKALASATGKSGFNLGEGVDPTSPVDGDLWVTTTNIFARVNGVSESLLGAGGVPAALSKMKTANTARTSAPTLTDDPHLAGFSLDANSFYKITAHLIVSVGASATPDFRFTLQLSQTLQSSEASYTIVSNSSVLTGDIISQVTTGQTVQMAASAVAGISYVGYIHTNASLASTVDFQWSQGTSSGFDTTLETGSWMTFEKIN